MSLKWTGGQNESGILRKKSDFKEKKEELFVFGYSCKLFRDDDKALHIDQGKHLIPWMGDENLKIDRYDARGALHDLSRLEAPPGGYDWRVELTKSELDVEQLCDEERYRALHTDEDEEEMYKEEELKRLHAAGYGQVSFNYETQAEQSPLLPAEVDEPFEPSEAFKALLSPDIFLPEGVKQNAIIEKTAKFIATQGAQMEILIKAKQQDNAQFKFLNKESPLHAYYNALINLVKTGKWPEKKVEPVVEEKRTENEDYLHPSLASTVIESAPSIPSIHYKPSADCDYTLLISKMRGEPILDESYPPVLAPGEVAPPGTEPLPPPDAAQITRAPVMYHHGQGDSAVDSQAHLTHYQQYAAYYQQYMAQQTQPQSQTQTQSQLPMKSQQKVQVVEKSEGPVKSTGLSLMKNYNTDSDSDSDYDDSSSVESKGKPTIIVPPEDVKVVIDKMAAYVARNGDDFEKIVRAKNDPRFTFLDPDNKYHPFYRKLMQDKRGGSVNGKGKTKAAPTVCFSIKKHKEPEPILPKPALPYESSSDEESEEKKTKQTEEQPVLKTNIPQVTTTNSVLPPVVVYKMEATQVNNLPVVKAIETKPAVNIVNHIVPKPVEIKEPPKQPILEPNNKTPEVKNVKSPTPDKKDRYKEEELRKEKKRHKEKKKEKERERKVEKESLKFERRSVDREREKRDRDLERDRRERHEKRKYNKQELDSEIITLEESEELIDLTGDIPEPKSESVADRQRKLERRQKAAEFLRRAGVEPSTLPASSLGSAMVDTLETLRKKKEQEEEKRRRREKKRQKERRAYEDEYDRYHRKSKHRKHSDDDSDYEGSKKKKRKKDKKSSKSKKKRTHSDTEPIFEAPRIPIDISSTLKELRSASPTTELVEELDDATNSFIPPDTSSESEQEVRRVKVRRSEENVIKKKTERVYSEGEWSSDSEDDSVSSAGKYD